MTKTQIQINRIAIQTRGVAPSLVNSAIASLGQELLTTLSEQRSSFPLGQKISIDKLDLGTIHLTQGQDSKQLSKAIAQAASQRILNQQKG